MQKQLQVWHLIVGFAVMVLGFSLSAGMAWQSVLQTQADVKAIQAKSEQRDIEFNGIKEDMREIKTDLRWIRENLK